ncbi:MAG: hypothetical protein M1470_00445 [Bacteroidetes bacterium]|nr:hypothetical protein [Bacteroidota bacterium]MCL5737219.1 hypothetical protein [Bacteroidota bacterium]
MLQQVEKKSSLVPVVGEIERMNDKGIKVNSEWWNISKFLTNVPHLEEGYKIEFKASKNFINEITKLTPPNASPIEVHNCKSKFQNGSAKDAAESKSGPKAPETRETKAEVKLPENGSSKTDPTLKQVQSKDYEVLGSCLKDAVYITDDIHEMKFSTQDIVKLALTLFIHRTS